MIVLADSPCGAVLRTVPACNASRSNLAVWMTQVRILPTRVLSSSLEYPFQWHARQDSNLLPSA